MLVVRDVNPAVLGDDPLVQGEDGLVARPDPAHCSKQLRHSRKEERKFCQVYCLNPHRLVLLYYKDCLLSHVMVGIILLHLCSR